MGEREGRKRDRRIKGNRGNREREMEREVG